MSIQICVDCRKRYRAHDGDDGRCPTCGREQREADREYAAAARMTLRVFGTNDPDVLLRDDKAKNDS